MPADFFKLTFEKIEEERELEGFTKKASAEFLKQIHYGIDEILRSGKVLYGDPISNYVSHVGRKITDLDPSLSNVRFYTLRSNVVNAFSTRQGIIFVTQGLIAQLSNEAQLAFVLAHEIAHYMKDHVIEGYKEKVDSKRSRNTQESKIKQLSIYSKEKEFEADRLGLELYNKAGYGKEEVEQVFDVLTYSYLPFDLKEIPLDYWNDDHLVIPPTYFTKELPKISAEEEFDDSKSSHPTSQSRRESVLKYALELGDWKNNVFISSSDSFYFVRNCARFETIRNDLYTFRYADVLYAIFLLESEFPDNLYLEQCKAKAWAGLLAAKVSGNFSAVTVNPAIVQGDPYQLHRLVRKLSKKQLYAVALRQVAVSRQKFPEDHELEALFTYAVSQLARDDQFKREDFQSIGYAQALAEFQKTLEERRDEFVDSLDGQGRAKEGQKPSKYDKIRRENLVGKVLSNESGEFKEDDFHVYALADVIFTDEFNELFDKAKAKVRLEIEAERSLGNLPPYQRQKIKEQEQEERLLLGLKEIILLEPRAIKIVKGNQLAPKKSEELELMLRGVVENLKGNQAVDVFQVGSLEFRDYGTHMFNQKAVLLNALEHMIEFDRYQVFPIDYLALKEIAEAYGTSKVCFVFVQSQNNPPSIPQIIGTSVFPPIWLFAAPFAIMTTYMSSFNAVVFDIQTYTFDGFSSYLINGTTNKLLIESLLTDFLQRLSSTPPND